MAENTAFRKILPASMERNGLKEPEGDVQTCKRRNVSLACTECQKKKTKCSGTTPCTRCATEACQCIYDPKSDRRRKAHVTELSNSHVTLRRVIAKVRSGTVEEVIAFIWGIQSQSTDQEAVEYLVQTLKEQ